MSDRAVQRYVEGLDPAEKVGSRHHITPRFYLERFSERSQVLVRDREDGTATLRSIDDLAVRDFYTSVHVEGFLDARLETVFSVMEREVSELLRRRMSSFSKALPFDLHERQILDQFVSTQALRGARMRRLLENVADAYMKITHEAELVGEDLASLEFVPHQNDHIAALASMAPRVDAHLARRPACLVRIDHPGFITCDEPVLLASEIQYAHREVLVPAQGLDEAETILVPLSPTTLLVYGPPGMSGSLPPMMLRGVEARELGNDVTELVVSAAYRWVIAHPANKSIRTRKLPPVGPILTVTGGQRTTFVSPLPTRRPLRSRPVRP
ncbi:uncharacterized protein DUF4238 [Cellulosimicrobium cellulans J34]|nr:uncharacterized protein DUF4238 [Cellulosimicrobium cellulans J34]SMF18450.1 Protein of unknown function [Cellulosimicrobium cellulans J1]